MALASGGQSGGLTGVHGAPTGGWTLRAGLAEASYYQLGADGGLSYMAAMGGWGYSTTR